MDSKHHALAKELFGEVCDLPETERHSHLRKLTSDTGIKVAAHNHRQVVEEISR